MSKGILVECLEDAVIENRDAVYTKGVLYTAVLEDNKYTVITRTHVPIEFSEKQFHRHFKLK